MNFLLKPFKITKVEAYEVLDSRGLPTVCAKVYSKNVFAKAMVPSGASTGSKEAVELRDQDPKRYFGKGVLNAVNNINTQIASKIVGLDCRNQSQIDQIMIDLDGTDNKGNLGANAILAVSLAVAKLAALLNAKPLYQYCAEDLLQMPNPDVYHLPTPMLNVINGGVHADNTLDFQEFMYVPVGAQTFSHAMQMASECFHALQKLLQQKKMNTNKGDEGGFAPSLKKAEEAFQLMSTAVKNAGYEIGFDKDMAFAIDAAASEMYVAKSDKYCFHKAMAAKLLTAKEAHKTSKELIKYWTDLAKKYPIVSIEDGLAENDWEGFSQMTASLHAKMQIVGDDLFCTNTKLVQQGIEKSAANAVLVKVNQIGTLSETLATIKLAHNANWATVISHRSGETEDTFIADLVVGTNAQQIKTGSMSRSERIAKYNRLLEIEHHLGNKAVYAGRKAFKFAHQG